MKIKNITIADFLLLSFLLMSCAEPAQPPTETYPDTVIIRELTEDNPLQFDWDEAMKNIYIAGKKFSFPDTVADLGEGFSLQGLPLENEARDDPKKFVAKYVTVTE